MNELKQVTTALDRKDYPQAAKLLKELQKNSPQNPWVKFYIARYYELNNQLESAEKLYRELLLDSANPKIVAQTRQAIQRLETLEQNRRKDAIAIAKNDPKNAEPGLLILEPISPENKPIAIQNISRILKIDSYTARMQIQSRGWRLYKTGTIGELRVYGEELLSAGIPVFWATFAQLQTIKVFRVQYFQTLSPQPTVICQNELDQLGSLTFNWSEISQRVEGLLPLFMEVMDYSPQRRNDKFRHKEITQDYAQICDLHLPNRNSILRICDQSYQFQQGFTAEKTIELDAKKAINQTSQNTARINWNNLIEGFNQQLSVPILSDFTPFAETALDYTQMLGRIKPQIDIERKSETPWDATFQLYSTLVFSKYQGQKV
ncbi:cyclic nucleotide-binding protein [Oscillatoriales cyanobacterium USR001]|nr:cyclic nucleotide-binding protein [Oscillatoriales cyanobacterium USR001]